MFLCKFGRGLTTCCPALIEQYCWLHRGTYSCALELCTGAPTDKCAPKKSRYHLPTNQFPITSCAAESCVETSRPAQLVTRTQTVKLEGCMGLSPPRPPWPLSSLASLGRSPLASLGAAAPHSCALLACTPWRQVHPVCHRPSTDATALQSDADHGLRWR